MVEQNVASVEHFEATETLDRAVVRALTMKRSSLLRNLERMQAAITELNNEYSSRLNELQTQAQQLQEAITHIEAVLMLDGHRLDAPQQPLALVAKPAVRRGISITDSAFALLQKTHKPLHYRELTLRLQEENLFIPGKNPCATLLSRINRDIRFKRTGGRGTYGLSDWRIRTPGKRRKKKRTRQRGERRQDA